MSTLPDKSREQETVLGVGWYRSEQWALLLSVSIDRDELESTHAEWLASAESSLETIRSTGRNPIKIDIDVEELLNWCKKKNIPIDGDARAHFIADKTRLMDQQKVD